MLSAERTTKHCQPTLDLLKAFAVDLGHLVLLFLQAFDAAREWRENYELLVFQRIVVVGLMIFQRSFHLPNCFDYAIGLLRQIILLPMPIINSSGAKFAATWVRTQ